MSADAGRRAELIAAAVADDLTDAERAELRAMAAADPTVDTEIDQYRRVAARMSDASVSLPWAEVGPSDSLRERVLGPDTTTRRTGGRPFLWAAAASVAGIAVGAASVLGIGAATDRPVTGPPGTLGAFEEIAFTGVPSGIDIEGGLVAHTWGTETVLEMEGVPDRGAYEVFVLEQSGAARASGTFLGSSVTIDCRMNAAVLRENVSGIEIRASDGSVLAAAAVPRT
ncbi:hypothetical protein [Rhodococcoides kyotonense]|uniref:Anti-sigma factor n=1 Tax=Rhodococcoides kyotonense TaxID=398843 RepID=A0A239MMW0_9NOCA|nr:hypothetical protein [Rhodococcus kyotonensis]SNT43442.1 hypothetical protein SAMN05421642_11952 [Rhodococcus kyotonensis]